MEVAINTKHSCFLPGKPEAPVWVANRLPSTIQSAVLMKPYLEATEIPSGPSPIQNTNKYTA